MAEKTQADQISVDLAADIASLQKAMLDIQTGRRAPPPWFTRTGFDTGVVDLGSLGRVQMVSATSGTMDRLDRADTPQAEADLEAEAVAEAVEKFPPELTLRRELSIRNKTFEPGKHWENLWPLLKEDRGIARMVLLALVGGRAYQMLKMATMWLSKIDVPTMIGSDPEPGGKDGPEVRPTA